MRVLVACEESQEVCIAFRERGHEAYSCDLQGCSGGHPEWHIVGDCTRLIGGSCEFRTMDRARHRIDGRWDLIVAHPPCTYLSKAGACRLYPTAGNVDKDRLIDGLQAKLFFYRFWLYGQYGCGKIAIENPVPLHAYELPECSQVIQPYQFGHPYSKTTCLWLFGLPPLMPTDVVCNYTPYLPSKTSRKLGGDTYGVARSQQERSKTFTGIARAMAEQWG